jgi:hypothetical protein
MFRPTVANPAQKRTLRPIYAQHQATSYGGFLDPAWARTFDILPGTVMSRLTAEVFTPFTTNVSGTTVTSSVPVLPSANAKPFGLSALFVAPNLGIDEVTATGTNLCTVWVGGPDAVFEVLAPAFDLNANWAGLNPTDGGRVLLTANNVGLLTPTGATNYNAVAELVDVESTDVILVRLNPFNFASSGTIPSVGGS